ncbi:hypothetical protein GIB67_004726 [Kingdonia uniflora]|uniref:Uncharacterized protein n=1 Tax=Kingdonia uniflora TaxID=39325 RepID=A0A7J7P5I6_9MAGN|nr:hypothetical protein GIB67_004726 [Kingdonia uniflora]
MASFRSKSSQQSFLMPFSELDWTCFCFWGVGALSIVNMVLGLKEIHIRVKIRANVDCTIDLLNVSEYRDNKIHTGWLDNRIAMQVRA